MASGNADRLQSAIADAKKAGLDDAELEAAADMLAKVQRQDAARERLQKAMQSIGTQTDDLQSALEEAEAALGNSGLDSDNSLLDEARKQASENAARSQLAEAMASGDPEQLREVLGKAAASGLTSEELEDAAELLDTHDRRLAATKELEDALQSEDPERLREALDEARSNGVDGELGPAAQARLAELEQRGAAKRRLAEALKSKDPDALRAAIEDGEHAGLIEDDLGPARDALDEQMNKTELMRSLNLTASFVGPSDRASPETPTLSPGSKATSPKPKKKRKDPFADAALDDTGTGSLGGLGSTGADTLGSSGVAPSSGSHADTPGKGCSPTAETRVFEKAEYVFKVTPTDDSSDDEVVQAIKQRLRKVYVSPAEALAQCMQVPAVANVAAGVDGDLPLVDAGVLSAFAGQLRFSMPRERAEKFLKGIDVACGGDGEPWVPVADFLGVFGAAPGAGSSSGMRSTGAGAGSSGAGSMPTGGARGFSGAGPMPAATREERKRQLQQQTKPSEHLRQMVIKQRVENLTPHQAQLVTHLREALFERRSNMQKMFKSVDLNDDGVVTVEEFLHALEGAGVAVGHEIDRARAAVNEEDAALMLSYFDRERNGVLHYNEFMRLLQGTIDLAPEARLEPQYAQRVPELGGPAGRHELSGTGLIRAAVGLRLDGTDDERHVQQAFMRWDVNSDGFISEIELLSVLRKVDPRIRDKDVRRLFEHADVNGDGAIDYREFIGWLFR